MIAPFLYLFAGLGIGVILGGIRYAFGYIGKGV